MQENRLLLWTKGKFKLIASSRIATCYHPTPEGMGIRAGHSITKKVACPSRTGDQEDNKKSN